MLTRIGTPLLLEQEERTGLTIGEFVGVFSTKYNEDEITEIYKCNENRT